MVEKLNFISRLNLIFLYRPAAAILLSHQLGDTWKMQSKVNQKRECIHNYYDYQSSLKESSLCHNKSLKLRKFPISCDILWNAWILQLVLVLTQCCIMYLQKKISNLFPIFVLTLPKDSASSSTTNTPNKKVAHLRFSCPLITLLSLSSYEARKYGR